jgi:dimethylamine/trimethylamine dehydrogenase
MEQHRIQRRLLDLGVTILTSKVVLGAHSGAVQTACVYSDREQELPCDSLVLVTARLPEDALASELTTALGTREHPTMRLIGDAWSPGTIASAVWDGRRYAEELEAPTLDDDEPPFRREVIALAPLAGRST